MNKFCLISLFFVLIISCIHATGNNESIKDFKKNLRKAESIEISFGWWGNDGFDLNHVDKVIDTADNISQFIDFLSNNSVLITECGYEGTIDFKQGGISILEERILFTIKCKRFVFRYNGNQNCVKINDNGVEYLNNLYEELKNQK